MSSTMISESARMASKSPSERRRTPASSGRRPHSAAIASARSARAAAKADPTVPWPSRPTRAVSLIAGEEIVVGLAAHHDARVAVLAEDDRGPKHAVVVRRHRVAVRAGGGGDERVADPRGGERRVVDEDV